MENTEKNQINLALNSQEYMHGHEMYHKGEVFTRTAVSTCKAEKLTGFSFVVELSESSMYNCMMYQWINEPI